MPCYHQGQKIWLANWDIPLKVDNAKLAPWFIGPFLVDKVINPVSVWAAPSLVIASPPYFPRLKPVRSCPLLPASVPLPPARLINRSPAFTVCWILCSRHRDRGAQYLDDWEGYRLEECSWLPCQLILDLDLIQTFHKAHPDQSWQPSRPSHWGGGGIVQIAIIRLLCDF